MNRAVDDAMFYLKNRITGQLFGPDGGPFPYQSLAAANSALARRRDRNFIVVTWILERPV